MQTIGKYQIIDTIGSGGMGIVYKAIDPRIERVVAIKTLSAKLDGKPELRRRLLSEARAAGVLSHKNIITIYEMDEDNGKAYLAMEFLDGNELDTLIAERTPFTMEQKLQIMAEVCEGLAHAHSMGVIHGDIKPGNIFLTRSGQVKILDFGLARLVSTEAASLGAGTPSYMSPEQVRGEAVDHRSDIFSAGVLFYELLAYRKPFHGESEHTTSYSICHREPDPVEAAAPDTPPAVGRIIARALAKAPGQRYQDIYGMLSDLNVVREDLEQRKRAVRGELDQELARLEVLVSLHGDLLGETGMLCAALKREYAELLSGSRQQGTTGSGRLPAVEYRRLVELRDRARQECSAQNAVVEKRRRTAYLLLEVEELRGAGQYEEALKLVEYLSRQDATYPNILGLHQEISRCAEQARAEAEARRQQARIKAILANVRAALGRGRLESAREELQQALSLDPSLAEGAELLAEIGKAETERRARREKEARIAQLLAEARRLKESPDRLRTLAVVQQILELDPANWYGIALSEELSQAQDSTKIHKTQDS